MKSKVILLFLVVAIASGCDKQGKKSSTSVNISQEKEKVALVLEKYVIANEKEEIGLVKDIWAPYDDILVIGTEMDEQIIGWDNIRKAVEKQFSKFEETYISVRDQTIHVNETGNTAWFSEFLNYNFIYKDQAMKFEGIRFTGVLEKTNGDWHIVQSHMSIPAKTD